MSGRPVTAGRGDVSQMADSLMAKLRDRPAPEPRDPRTRAPDTLYYTRTTVVEPGGGYHWLATVHRGMAPRVPGFDVKVPSFAAIDTRLVRRYALLLEQHGYDNEEARERAGTCKLELVDEDTVSLMPTGRVTG